MEMRVRLQTGISLASKHDAMQTRLHLKYEAIAQTSRNNISLCLGYLR